MRRRRLLPPHGRDRPAAAIALLLVVVASSNGLRLSPSQRRCRPAAGVGLRYADYRLDGSDPAALFRPEGPDRGVGGRDWKGAAPLSSLGPAWRPPRRRRRRKRRGGKGQDGERSTVLRSLLRRVSNTWWIFRETIRMRLEKCTVYVLECEGDKYYVGSTTNRRRRLAEHLSRRGSRWTRLHRPLRVHAEYRRIPSHYVLGLESAVTASLMLERGVNNVRGSMYCSVRDYHEGDVDGLTRFLGHYGDLDYGRVRAELKRTLPGRRRDGRRVAGPCYACGGMGHIAADCPHRKVGEGGGLNSHGLRP